MGSRPIDYDHNYMDGSPVVGVHPILSNVFMATGFNGRGAMYAPGVGRALTELMLGKDDRPRNFLNFFGAVLSVADPYVWGPPGVGSGSFCHQAKILRKTLIPTVLFILFDFLSLKKEVNVPSKSNKQKTKISVLLASCRSMTKIAGSESGSGSISQRH